MKWELVIFDISGTLRDGQGKLFAGLKDILHKLHNDGVTLAVASSLSVGGIRRFLDENGVEELFAVIKSADQAEPKPHPAMIEKILLETGVEANCALMVGDSPEDIRMAKAAGVASCAALWRDGLDEHQFVALQPDFMIQLTGELLTVTQQ